MAKDVTIREFLMVEKSSIVAMTLGVVALVAAFAYGSYYGVLIPYPDLPADAADVYRRHERIQDTLLTLSGIVIVGGFLWFAIARLRHGLRDAS